MCPKPPGKGRSQWIDIGYLGVMGLLPGGSSGRRGKISLGS